MFIQMKTIQNTSIKSEFLYIFSPKQAYSSWSPADTYLDKELLDEKDMMASNVIKNAQWSVLMKRKQHYCWYICADSDGSGFWQWFVLNS